MATEIVVKAAHYRLTLPGGTEVYATQDEYTKLAFMLANPGYVEEPPAGALLLRETLRVIRGLPGRLTCEDIVAKAARR